MNEAAFLAAILADPAEPTAWLALADWLEERGDPRGELLRLTRILQQPDGTQRPAQEDRLRDLLTQGLRPCWPTVTNSLGMELALIPAGTFLMGSPEDEEGREACEGPRHEVTLSRPFFLGTCPVTGAQYTQVMGSNPRRSPSRRGGFPVVGASWNDAVAFCQQLSEMPEEKRSGRVYRLPTEAEWEYACRGGRCSSTAFSCGRSLSAAQANFSSRRGPRAVGSYPPNTFGLYDMHGNVWEWCADWYEHYPHRAVTDPAGPAEGWGRVARGGCWRSTSSLCCRSAVRLVWYPEGQSADLGFRVACSFPPAVS